MTMPEWIAECEEKLRAWRRAQTRLLRNRGHQQAIKAEHDAWVKLADARYEVAHRARKKP